MKETVLCLSFSGSSSHGEISSEFTTESFSGVSVTWEIVRSITDPLQVVFPSFARSCVSSFDSSSEGDFCLKGNDISGVKTIFPG